MASLSLSKMITYEDSRNNSGDILVSQSQNNETNLECEILHKNQNKDKNMNFIINELKRILEIRDSCFICKKEFEMTDDVSIALCQHSFHNQCLKENYKKLNDLHFHHPIANQELLKQAKIDIYPSYCKQGHHFNFPATYPLKNKCPICFLDKLRECAICKKNCKTNNFIALLECEHGICDFSLKQIPYIQKENIFFESFLCNESRAKLYCNKCSKYKAAIFIYLDSYNYAFFDLESPDFLEIMHQVFFSDLQYFSFITEVSNFQQNFSYKNCIPYLYFGPYNFKLFIESEYKFRTLSVFSKQCSECKNLKLVINPYGCNNKHENQMNMICLTCFKRILQVSPQSFPRKCTFCFQEFPSVTLEYLKIFFTFLEKKTFASAIFRGKK